MDRAGEGEADLPAIRAAFGCFSAGLILLMCFVLRTYQQCQRHERSLQCPSQHRPSAEMSKRPAQAPRSPELRGEAAVGAMDWGAPSCRTSFSSSGASASTPTCRPSRLSREVSGRTCWAATAPAAQAYTTSARALLMEAAWRGSAPHGTHAGDVHAAGRLSAF